MALMRCFERSEDGRLIMRGTAIFLISTGIGMALSGIGPGAFAAPQRVYDGSAANASAAWHRQALRAKRLERQRRTRYYHVGSGYSGTFRNYPDRWYNGQWYTVPQTGGGYNSLGTPPAGWNTLGTPPAGYSPLGPPPPPGYSPLGPVPPPGYSPLGTPPAPPVVPPPMFPKSPGQILPQGGQSILGPRR